MRWYALKELGAMEDDYDEQDWYDDLNDDEMDLLEALREAQHNQGDNQTLKQTAYNIGIQMEDIEEEDPSDSEEDHSLSYQQSFNQN